MAIQKDQRVVIDVTCPTPQAAIARNDNDADRGLFGQCGDGLGVQPGPDGDYGTLKRNLTTLWQVESR